MRLGNDRREIEFEVDYMNERIKLKSQKKAKINGVLFQNDPEKIVDDNVCAILQKVDKQLKSWSRRALSTLGKIQICKTYGISQVIYLMQSVTLKECHIKRINALLYKFIWNRHYLAAKAPERIKRDIVCTPIKCGGLGMLDIADLDRSLKLKMYGRLLVTKHPFLTIIKNNLDLNFFKPTCKTPIDRPTIDGLNIIAIEREKYWDNRELASNVALLQAIQACTIKSMLTPNGCRSIAYFMLRRSGKAYIGELGRADLGQIRRYIDKRYYPKLETAVAMNQRLAVQIDIGDCILIKGRFRKLAICASKEIRESISPKPLLVNFKVGLDLNARQSVNWLYRLSKLTSVQHQYTLLRIAHGEIYTQERLVKFGLTNEISCPRCDCVEDLEHKILRCDYVERIWNYALNLTGANLGEDRLELVMGIHLKDPLLCLHAELMKRIISLPRENEYLVHPRHFVTRAIRNLVGKERDSSIKNGLKDLLERAENRN
jgi:hypothetical protein